MTNTVTLNRAIALLRQNKIGVIPTDTVYGLAVRVTDQAAVERFYKLKNRERKPGTIIASNIQQLRDLGVPEKQLQHIKHLWPNPISIVLPLAGKHDYLHQGLGDIAVRVVSDKKLRALLEQTGPLLTSSANHPGKPGATVLQEAYKYFGDSIDFYVDGGDLSANQPSTIIRIANNGKIELLRQGAYRLSS